ncbi:MAG: NUDIX domain-containing protein [Patescibacteria group bacterium]|nr:NUDIX domain-containing protein [bacterium]MDZ4226923.1 NUDIX domain-containing protein [Patescibacteria group bacterium]
MIPRPSEAPIPNFMEELLLLNPENVSDEEARSYPVREAARAVVLDGEGRIALLHVSKKNYYKLPGGGLDAGEDRMTALKRECREEIGCEVDVVGEIGIILEYRKILNLKQVSYYYFAKVKGAKGEPALTEDEMNEGFELVWLSYDAAKRAMSDSEAADVEGSAYIVPRDTALLKEAAKYLTNHS